REALVDGLGVGAHVVVGRQVEARRHRAHVAVAKQRPDVAGECGFLIHPFPPPIDRQRRRLAVFPGQTPVRCAYPVAPARSTSAFTPPNTAPWSAAATMTSRQPLSSSLAAGASSSPAVRLQSRRNSTLAAIAPTMLTSRPNGL